ncbi:MAG: hypothetical protein Q4E53_04485 [Eubacteriales bacterium]|nr:hypothetical protein [Eubacteriales bacterium]
MSKNVYKVLSIIFLIITIIGVIAFLGGARKVNAGAVICPAIITAIAFKNLTDHKNDTH